MSTATRTRTSVCQNWAARIAVLRREVAAKQRQVSFLRDELNDLQGQPNPDPAEISALKARLVTVQNEAEEKRSDLVAFEDDFQFFCS